MKKRLTFLLLIVGFRSFASTELVELSSFGTNPGNLKMFVHAKPNVDSAKVPLIIVLHGCGQNAKDVADLTGWNKLADLHNYIVLYPQQKITNNPQLCFNWFNNNDIEKGQGECESIFQMICALKKQYKIDSTKIFITGLSAGAAMSMVMISTHPEVFKAAAVFAGTAYKIAEKPIEGIKVLMGNKTMHKDTLMQKVLNQNLNYKGKYPKLIIYQGLKDQIVKPINANYIIQQWTSVFKTDSIEDKKTENFKSINDITRFEYYDTKKETCIIYYEVKKLSHQLLIKPGKANNEGGKLGLFGVNKGFHSTYQTAIDFGLLKFQEE